MKPLSSLFSRILKKKRLAGESYLALFLMEKSGIVHVLQRHDGVLRSTHSERFMYTSGWDHIVEDIDDVLYRLETGLGSVPDKAIFFVYSHLVETKTREIKKTYLHKIKELVKSLDLEALGYIEAREAAVDYIQNKKRTPPSMILIEIDSDTASLFIYHNGQVAFHKTLESSNDLSQSVIEVLTTIKPQISLPHDIVVYSYSDTDAEKLSSLNIDFDSSLFDVQPHFDIINQSTMERGLVSLFSSQIAGTQVPAEVYQEEREEEKDTDVNAMGFVIGDDVDNSEEESEPAYARTEEPESKRGGPNIINVIMARLRSFKIPTFAASHTLLAVAGIVLILVSFGAIEFFFHKATVTVVMPSQKLEKELVLTADDLPLQMATSSAQYTESKKATGVKTIGEKAKGSVTVYNSSLTGSKSLSSGTTLSGPNGLKFVLSDSVNVASAEGDASSIKASTKDVAVSASAIGSEYNVAGGNKFTIEGQSEGEVIAKNSTEFSGGSKKSITIVSSSDIESLKKLVTEKLKKQKPPSEENTGDSIAIPQLSSTILDDVTTSPDLSDEADTVKLSATGIMQSYFYNGSELKKIIADKLKPEVTNGNVIKPSDITQTVKSATKSKSNTKVTLEVRARATPTIDLSKVAPALVAKSTEGGERALKDTFKARSATIQVMHPISLFNGWLPLRKENIAVDIQFQDQ